MVVHKENVVCNKTMPQIAEIYMKNAWEGPTSGIITMKGGLGQFSLAKEQMDRVEERQSISELKRELGG